MSWISKALGLDKNKEALDQINAVLRNAGKPELRKAHDAIVRVGDKYGVPVGVRETMWDEILSALKVPKELL